MPPIPKTLDAHTCTTIELLTRRLQDLEGHQIPRLRDCTGSLATQQQYNSEIRDDLDTCAQQLETLEVAVEDQDGEMNRRALQKIVTHFQTHLTKLRKDSRAALWTSKQVIDANSAASRNELLWSATKETQTGVSSADDQLMKANNDVTAALRRTMDIMQGELEKSVLSNQILEESSASLRSASTQHDTLTLLMGTSKQLIIALEKADWLDRMLIISGLVFFGLVVLLVLKQRIFDRGMRLAFWWTRFLPSPSSAKIFDKAERGLLSSISSLSSTSKALGASTISSLISSATALVSSKTEDKLISSARKGLETTSDVQASFSSIASTLEDALSGTPSTLTRTTSLNPAFSGSVTGTNETPSQSPHGENTHIKDVDVGDEEVILVTDNSANTLHDEL